MKKTAWIFFLLFIFGVPDAGAAQPIRIGSKKFTESYILAEIMAQKIERELQIPVERKFGLEGTLVCFEALKGGAIDLYPEYSGTMLKVLLKTDAVLDFEEMNGILQKRHRLEWIDPFGFDNSYALAMLRTKAAALGIENYSDLARHRELTWGLSYEFLNREDGWPALRAFYRFQPAARVRGMEHTLVYEGVQAGLIDILDVYTTDAKIMAYDLKVLKDDRHFFPHYWGAPLVRQDTLRRHPGLKAVLESLSGEISDETMRKLNAEAEIGHKSFARVAHEFLQTDGKERFFDDSFWKTLLHRTERHLKLVFVSVMAAVLVGIPLGMLMTRVGWLAGPALYVTGVIQTIPSIALLALMIPLFGIGQVPALVALFLYGLLPIVRNTYVGLKNISPVLLQAADGLGMRPAQRLWRVELPLALPTLLAGIKTSAVINVGTATLAAFIGAGGLGEAIVTGLALNNVGLILQGAIPAALLAIAVEYSLSLFDRTFRWKGAVR
ncbi:MAG: glycine betaine ABC transporter substrate-binding protein [Deltaproteobacteria bacterium]|nr:glycine betaine ABC transporter substrate-binding protein [Deltaproteobacteria bacterium]MDZ4224739.1 glycine betaine ABC transporter substrate-binding protein [bacterium]